VEVGLENDSGEKFLAGKYFALDIVPPRNSQTIEQAQANPEAREFSDIVLDCRFNQGGRWFSPTQGFVQLYETSLSPVDLVERVKRSGDVPKWSGYAEQGYASATYGYVGEFGKEYRRVLSRQKLIAHAKIEDGQA